MVYRLLAHHLLGTRVLPDSLTVGRRLYKLAVGNPTNHNIKQTKRPEGHRSMCRTAGNHKHQSSSNLDRLQMEAVCHHQAERTVQLGLQDNSHRTINKLPTTSLYDPHHHKHNKHNKHQTSSAPDLKIKLPQQPLPTHQRPPTVQQ
jgi:hypothetical protein